MRGYTNSSELRMYAAFVLILLPTAALCYKGQLSIGTIGSTTLIIILFAMLAGSFIEIPFAKIRTKKPEQLAKFAPILEEIYSVPIVEELHIGKQRVFNTTLTVNLGGAVIPAISVLYLLLSQPDNTALEIMLIVILAVTMLTEVMGGVGTLINEYIGLIALPFALIISAENAASITMISGVGGILIGNILSIIAFNKEKTGSAFISIGGAGSFKSIYVTTIIASLVSYFVA